MMDHKWTRPWTTSPHFGLIANAATVAASKVSGSKPRKTLLLRNAPQRQEASQAPASIPPSASSLQDNKPPCEALRVSHDFDSRLQEHKKSQQAKCQSIQKHDAMLHAYDSSDICLESCLRVSVVSDISLCVFAKYQSIKQFLSYPSGRMEGRETHAGHASSHPPTNKAVIHSRLVVFTPLAYPPPPFFSLFRPQNSSAAMGSKHHARHPLAQEPYSGKSPFVNYEEQGRKHEINK